jgi:hypothetical protein
MVFPNVRARSSAASCGGGQGLKRAAHASAAQRSVVRDPHSHSPNCFPFLVASLLVSGSCLGVPAGVHVRRSMMLLGAPALAPPRLQVLPQTVRLATRRGVMSRAWAARRADAVPWCSAQRCVPGRRAAVCRAAVCRAARLSQRSAAAQRRVTRLAATKKTFTSFDGMIAESDVPVLVDFYAVWCAG